MKSDRSISVVMPVLTPNEFLRAMTEFAIKTLRINAENPKNFQLVVVEAGGEHFADRPDLWIDKYIAFNPPIGGVKELNAGIDVADGDFVVFTGNDIFVPPAWDTLLLEPFDKYPDCGISSLAAKESGVATIGPPEKILGLIVEGMYSPFCMWRNKWRMDEAYHKIYQDSDLVMRMYQKGLRAYRNCGGHVFHLGRVTSDTVAPVQHARDLAIDEETFYQRWKDSPLMMFGLIRYSQWHYGQEHQSLLNPIHRHV